MDKSRLLADVLPAPKIVGNTPATAQWLSGEGAGSWFDISVVANSYKIVRYSPEGVVECSGIFEQVHGPKFDIGAAYEFAYISHCASVSIMQNGIICKFERK